MTAGVAVPESAETPSRVPVLVAQLPSAAVPRIRSATVPSLPATGSELRNALALSLSRAIAVSSLTTSWGATELRRESPEPSTAWTSAPTDFANRSTASEPVRREPRLASAAPTRFSSISAKKLFEGTLVSSIRAATRGEATSASGSSSSSASGRSARPTRPSTSTPCFRSASLIAAAATSSGSEA